MSISLSSPAIAGNPDRLLSPLERHRPHYPVAIAQRDVHVARIVELLDEPNASAKKIRSAVTEPPRFRLTR